MGNEFVMVPRAVVDRIADHCKFWKEHPYLEAISDIEFGLREILAKPAEQHQGEPAAIVTTDANDKPVIEFLSYDLEYGTELYTHADPGEVERLREAIEQLGRERRVALRGVESLEKERDTLRAQLAERIVIPDGYAVVPIKPTKAMRDACRVAGKLSVWDDMMAAALSASAEPSAPVERDERAEFLKAMASTNLEKHLQADENGRFIEPAVSWTYGGWLLRSRAALERKP